MASEIHKSRYSIEIPDNIDLLSFIFSSGDNLTRQQPQFYDAFHPDRCYSLAQGEALTKRVGKGLRDFGIQEDDKIVLYSANNLYFPILLWGVIASGAIFSAVSQTASASELETQLKDLEATILISSVDGLKTAQEAAKHAGIPESRVFVFCDPLDEAVIRRATKIQPWTAFWASEIQSERWTWHKSTDPNYLANKTVIINYSSGTTGTPKGVEITHANIIANSSQLVYNRTRCDGNNAQSRSRSERLQRSGERWLAPLPMYHAYGQMYYCVNAARMCAKVFVMDKYTIASLLHFLDIYRITFLTGVPALLVQISKQRPGIYNLNALEYALTGSAPLGSDIGAVIETNFLPEGLGLKQGWGMTETVCSISGFTPEDENDPKSVGYLNPNCEGKVVAVDDEQGWGEGDVPDGVVAGELWVTGANIMKGYYKRPEQTAQTVVLDSDGKRWLRTGDVAYFDQDGKIYIIDRLKDLIKAKGMQVSPAELEAAILLNEKVTDVAVVGAKIDHGEYPRAFVVRKDKSLTEEQVHDIIRRKFSPHKWLTGGVYFVEEIPKTGSGKVMRRKLPNPKARPLKL